MTTKESIHERIEALSEEQLREIEAFLDQLGQSAQPPQGETIMEKLRRIQYKAPPDFSTNWEHYLNEDLDSETDIR